MVGIGYINNEAGCLCVSVVNFEDRLSLSLGGEVDRKMLGYL